MIYSSKIVKGYGRGRKIGFPTLNLVVPRPFVEKHGAYAVRVLIGDKEYAGALHFGPTPTFSDNSPTLEIFVLDYNADEPIEKIKFEILDYLRPIRRFANAEDLTAQITKDIAKIREIYHSD